MRIMAYRPPDGVLKFRTGMSTLLKTLRDELPLLSVNTISGFATARQRLKVTAMAVLHVDDSPVYPDDIR
ncbi:hypothetical protein DSJ_25655 (plasmid) [Pantoea stewartii subsp. stewartii DC283]|uniref:Uncharacterized protein n=2 Tax=Erwiniaceae TaxID=1903409 RepID=H3RKD2_PANSE|nr:hypothetical protein DSJ_25655 [Pantoea stewartii subsp. stewartii DC283]EHT98173.1 hypothetical protein CKS_3120 [Pantoea stewartii subsp. stewartii DC283]KKW51158.1 hypothetical protein XB02_07825 [Pantoea ananatis]KTS26364.1 hypothetical protein NS381_17825 [Pantoea stewartii]